MEVVVEGDAHINFDLCCCSQSIWPQGLRGSHANGFARHTLVELQCIVGRIIWQKVLDYEEKDTQQDHEEIADVVDDGLGIEAAGLIDEKQDLKKTQPEKKEKKPRCNTKKAALIKQRDAVDRMRSVRQQVDSAGSAIAKGQSYIAR